MSDDKGALREYIGVMVRVEQFRPMTEMGMRGLVGAISAELDRISDRRGMTRLAKRGDEKPKERRETMLEL